MAFIDSTQIATELGITETGAVAFVGRVCFYIISILESHGITEKSASATIKKAGYYYETSNIVFNRYFSEINSVKIKKQGTTEETVLTAVDYELSTRNFESPAVPFGFVLLNRTLKVDEYVELNAKFGLATTAPNDLLSEIYNIVQVSAAAYIAAQKQQKAGSEIKRKKMGSVEIEYGVSVSAAANPYVKSQNMIQEWALSSPVITKYSLKLID